jgi:hypothetical protein
MADDQGMVLLFSICSKIGVALPSVNEPDHETGSRSMKAFAAAGARTFAPEMK